MPNNDWRKLYPFAPHTATIDGYRYHYVDDGTGDVLLMVHGNPTWSFYYRKLVLAFRDRYRCVAVDHIGCGLSDKPQSYPYRLERHTANLMQLIDQLDLRNITLLGHDWGGAIGLGAAVAMPDRFQRLVLFNTGAFPPPRVPWRIAVCRLPGVGTYCLRRLNVFSRSALRMATRRPRGLPPEVQSGMLAPYNSWENRVGVAGFVRDIPLTRRHATYRVLEKLESDLASLRSLPVQLIWGMRDWCFTERCLDRIVTALPHARVHRVPNAGHWVVEDEPEQVIAVVREFLQMTAAVH